MFNDSKELLKYSEEPTASLTATYEASLQQKSVPAGLVPRVKSILESQRSALDYIASEIVTTGKGNPQFPILGTPDKFKQALPRNLNGLDDSRPDLVGPI